ERLPQAHRCHAADGEFGGAVQKFAPVDAAVYVFVEQTQQLRVEIARLFSFHRWTPFGLMRTEGSYRKQWCRSILFQPHESRQFADQVSMSMVKMGYVDGADESGSSRQRERAEWRLALDPIV